MSRAVGGRNETWIILSAFTKIILVSAQHQVPEHFKRSHQRADPRMEPDPSPKQPKTLKTHTAVGMLRKIFGPNLQSCICVRTCQVPCNIIWPNQLSWKPHMAQKSPRDSFWVGSWQRPPALSQCYTGRGCQVTAGIGSGSLMTLIRNKRWLTKKWMGRYLPARI